MTLDNESLEILRAVESGRQVFSPSAEADDARLAFDRMVDRILGLADAGLLEGSYNMTLPDYTGGIGKYASVQVIGITEAGRRTLARHQPPAEAIAVVVRKKLRQEFSGRGQEFWRKVNEVVSAATQRGALKASRVFVLIRDIIAQEYGIRAGVVLQRWQEVIVSQKLVFTPEVAELITTQAKSALAKDCEDIEEALDKAIRVSGYKGPDDMTTEGLRQRALEALEADVEFAMITPGLPIEPGRAGDQFIIHGNVGAVQTGAGSSATVTMHIGPSEREDILQEFQELRRLVHEAGLPREQQQSIEETLALAIAEAEKPAPNAITLRSLAMGTAITIQTIGAIPGAVEVARRLGTLLGFGF